MSGPLPTFADGKAPEAMRTIGEVADGLGIKQHILRYWEQQFPMLKPLKRSGGRRLYRPEDVAVVATIDRLVNRDGYTLKGARAVLSGAAAAVVAPVIAPAVAAHTAPTGKDADAAEIAARLKSIRQRLDRALATA